MALTDAERRRLERLETGMTQLAKLVKGGGSGNQLNRLLVLAQSQVDELTRIVENLESRMEELLTLAEKLQ
jgi:hypothetical protein